MTGRTFSIGQSVSVVVVDADTLTNKKLSWTKRIFIKDIAFFIRADMHVVDKDFTLVNLYKGFL